MKRWIFKFWVVFLFSAWSSVRAQEITWPVAPKRNVWLAAGGNSFGDGSVADLPLDVSTVAKLGRVLNRLAGEQGYYGAGMVLHFLPGEYETYGIRLRPRWHIVGAGMGKTTIKLVPDPRHQQIKSAYLSVIGGGWGPQSLVKRDFNNIRIADVSLDCNWSNTKEALGPILKKASGIDLLAKQVLVERVRVSRFGAVGGRTSWREVFPIRVISGMGDGAALPGYPDSIIEIRYCVVEDFVRGSSTGTDWSYCTGILVSHRGADPVNGMVQVRVHHNEIRNITNGIAFGGAFVRHAEFYENTITNCGIGFNFDTGQNQNVSIRNNHFFDCVGGGSVNDGKAFVIQDNTFRLIAPKEPRFVYWHNGLRLWDHTRGFLVEGNRFFFDGETKTTARGILLYGKSVGLRQFQDDADKWHRQIDPHRFHNNHYERLRLNLAGPQKVHQDMHLVVAERAVHLTGEGDAVQFSWPDD